MSNVFLEIAKNRRFFFPADNPDNPNNIRNLMLEICSDVVLECINVVNNLKDQHTEVVRVEVIENALKDHFQIKDNT